ncbi:MAG: lycopene cyclase family protein, partial [Pseudomonadota bacterium]
MLLGFCKEAPIIGPLAFQQRAYTCGHPNQQAVVLLTGTEEYDYVIVGAGSAGCALANRLSADPNIKVCLIEAGKKDNSLLVRMPAGVGSLLKGEGTYNWGFFTEPQKHMNGR